MKDKLKSIERLQQARSEIPNLKNKKGGSPEFNKWHRDTEVALGYIFDKAEHIKDFNDISYSPLMFTTSTPDSLFQQTYIRGLCNADALLSSMIDEIKEYWPDKKELTPGISKNPISKDNKKVFIVHGHDNEVKEAVARFTEKLGLNPIILHEQASMNQTIIEKFERNADVVFSIVLLTPDDVAIAKNDSGNAKDRARQNVIFEMGYFIGRLGRKNVCAITKGDIEIPSDYSGIIYIPYDGGSWKLSLVKELKAVGLDIDANCAF